jgi:hypothetical protein
LSIFIEWFAERRRRNLERVNRLKETCEKYPDEIRYENPTHLSRRQFDFERDLEIMSCSIHKAGLNIVRRDYKVPDWKWQKIIFVKEPIERLAWYFHRNNNYQKQVINQSMDFLRNPYFRQNQL